jgi:TetR/AcrR family transcriptional regulator, transcriptional repressor of bet genes
MVSRDATSSPRSRRQFHHESMETRKRDLLEATLQAVSDLGLQGATVREIAKRAGVTPGLIRHYFEGKDQLFTAAYRHINETMFDTALQCAERFGKDPTSKLGAYVRAGFRSPSTDARNLTLWATFVSQVFVNPSIASINRETYLFGRSRLERIVEEAMVHQGRDPAPGEARSLAIAVTGLVDGLWLEATMAAELFAEGELEQIAIQSVEKLLGFSLGT